MDNLTNTIELEKNELIIFAQSAIDKVRSLMEEENNYSLKLRIFVQGGGCSGFQYGFSFEDDKQDDDFLITKKSNDKEISFLIDPMSAQYLQGATIDFVSNLEGEQFVIKNPNASTSCGCGSSFSV